MNNQGPSQGRPTDLASILQALSNYAPPVPTRSELQYPFHGTADRQPPAGSSSSNNNINKPQSQPPRKLDDEAGDNDDYDPESYNPNQPLTSPPVAIPRRHAAPVATSASAAAAAVASATRLPQPVARPAAKAPAPAPAPAAEPRPSEPARNTVTAANDPRSIITWPAALRFTTRLLLASPETATRIRTLIANQRTNERQWWSGRENLLALHRARETGRAKIQDVLRSIGNMATAATTAATTQAGGKSGARGGGDGGGEDKDKDEDDEDEEARRLRQQRSVDEAAEVRAYDVKVHRLMGKLNDDQERELAALKIPFFGLNAKTKASFKEGELEELRGKMLPFLEEFVKD